MKIRIVICAGAAAQGYETKRAPDGPFAFSISGIEINEGSSLTRETILFNDPSAPVQLKAHSTKAIYRDRGFRFSGSTELDVMQPIVAVQVRTILYDVFGQHMKNLANTEPKDFSAGTASIDGEWRAYDSDITRMLTTVTYVARVRLLDGTQWVFDAGNLQRALSSLNLEQKIGETDEE